jgi:carbon-monoxide dehydrogenase large subunit
MSTPQRWIGYPLRRLEDGRFLRGEARYVDDIVLPRMLRMVVVRSPHAHARLGEIRADAVLRAPGIVRVITARDLDGRVQSMPVNAQEGVQVERAAAHPILAAGKVRYVGQPVAAIIAESQTAALDAAELLEIDYEPLPAVVDPQRALDGGVVLHESLGSNVIARWSRSGGDVEQAFRSARHIVKGTFHIPRLAAAPIEPRAEISAYDPGTDLLTQWSSSQDPHRPRAQLARVLGRPDDRVRMIVPDVGGAFGAKGAMAAEAAVTAVAAMDLRRPVKWIETRRENLLAMSQGRGQDAEVEMAVDADGRILGVRGKIIADIGAYFFPATAGPLVTTCMLLTGSYAIPASQVELLGVATNKVPTAPYRGAGRPEAAYVVERMIELVARETGIDSIELRRRNFIPADRFPYTTPLGFVYDSGNYHQALDHALAAFDYTRRREEQQRARAQGRLVGIGIGVYVERAAGAPWESAAVAVDPGGRVIVRPGSNSHGQGHETSFAQITADALGIDPHAVVVEHGDSAIVPRGVGTFGSRSTTVGGSALVVALDKVREKATRIAAHLLEASPGDIEWDAGRLRVRGTDRSVAWPQVTAAAYDPTKLTRDIEMGLNASGYFTLPGPVFPFGVYAAAVEIDRETGQVQVLKFVAIDDAGRIVNPLLAEGQVFGSTVQGLGESLVEEVIYDEDGQPQTATFADYAILRAPDIPLLYSEFVETPSPFNPLGAKGIGESGSIGTPATMANAVADALAPLGIRHVDVPYTPAKMWRLINDASDS